MSNDDIQQLGKVKREGPTDVLTMLKAAADRCDGYLMQYSLEVVWSLTPIGLKLEASWGADKFTRYVDYEQLRSARFDILQQTEQAALAGLSS